MGVSQRNIFATGGRLGVLYFYLGILEIQDLAGRNFITSSRVYSLLITQAKMQTEINNS